MNAPLKKQVLPDVDPELIEAIKSFPVRREAVHCADSFSVPPFDLYGSCPKCGSRVKVRGFSATPEIEDVFDAVFEWLNQPGAQAVAADRQRTIAADK